MQDIMKFIDKNIRPKLNSHDGDLEVVGLKDGVLSIRFKGQCSGCPSAKMTFEDLVEEELKQAFPKIKRVCLEDNFSSTDYELAKKLLKSHEAKDEG